MPSIKSPKFPLGNSRVMPRVRRHWRLVIATVYRVLRTSGGLFSSFLLVLILASALLAPVLAPFGPAAQQVGIRLDPPSAAHWFGTDEFGRDVFSRVLYAARVPLTVSLGAVALGGAVGTLSGSVAAYVGGRVDLWISRTVDVLFAFPAILIGLIVIATRGTGLSSVALAIVVINVPVFARVSRAETLRESRMDYVMAADTLGASPTRVLFRHIMPNTLGPVLAQTAIAMGYAVLLEAALTFLGLGIQPPTPSWGGMLDAARPYLRQAPWLAVYPGLALALLVVGFVFVSDALRDAFDPREERG